MTTQQQLQNIQPSLCCPFWTFPAGNFDFLSENTDIFSCSCLSPACVFMIAVRFWWMCLSLFYLRRRNTRQSHKNCPHRGFNCLCWWQEVMLLLSVLLQLSKVRRNVPSPVAECGRRDGQFRERRVCLSLSETDRQEQSSRGKAHRRMCRGVSCEGLRLSETLIYLSWGARTPGLKLAACWTDVFWTAGVLEPPAGRRSAGLQVWRNQTEMNPIREWRSTKHRWSMSCSSEVCC